MSSAMNAGLKSLHDRLLAEKPEGAVHDSEVCPICSMAEGANTDGNGDMTTFTEDEVKAKVDEAVKAATEDLDKQLKDLKASLQTSEADAAVTAVRVELDGKIREMQDALDKAMIELTNISAERDAIVSWLEAEAKAQEDAKAIQARKDERVAKVKEVANFPEDYLEKNAERFAAMSDEDFEAACESWSALKPVSAANNGADQVPAHTALHAGREATGSAGYSATKDMFALRRERGFVDLSTL